MSRPDPLRRLRLRAPRRAAALLLPFSLALPAGQAMAQDAVRVLQPAAIYPQQTLPQTNPKTVAPSAGAAAALGSGIVEAHFILSAVAVQGAAHIDPAALAATWRGEVGRSVSTQDILAIANRIATLYSKDGFALVSVQVPKQDFAGGVARIDVTEGYVGAVTIEGNTKGAKLGLLKSYAAAIIADRPLRRPTLERYILLMNDIPGLKVGSSFEPIPGQPGVARLHLRILRSPVQGGLALTSQGINTLGGTQVMTNIAVNSLLQEGDQTQATFGFPFQFSQFQYYGLDHTFPIGHDGATLTVGGGYIVTHPSGPNPSGHAWTTSTRFAYPIIRQVHQSLIATASFDMLNSSEALLGQSLSDERTRSLRLGAIYGVDDPWGGTTIVSATLSQGLDIFGARRGSVAFGGPDYTKISGRLQRNQKLPLHFVLRGKLAFQYTDQHLPDSEQFLFGGPDFGQAFDYAYLSGDRGLAAAIELAHPIPVALTTRYFAGSELFGYVDWGEVHNLRTAYELPYEHAASAGGGVRIKILHAVTLELAVATVLDQPPQFGKAQSPRFLFGFSGSF